MLFVAALQPPKFIPNRLGRRDRFDSECEQTFHSAKGGFPHGVSIGRPAASGSGCGGVTPVLIIAAILMLPGNRARTTSIGFAGGWLSGIVVATTLFVLLFGLLDTDDGPSTGSAWIKLLIGLALFAVGFRPWRGRDTSSQLRAPFFIHDTKSA